MAWYQKYRLPLILVIITILFRILFLIPVLQNEERAYQNDTGSYTLIASNLVAGNGYSHCTTPPYVKSLVRTPVYPFFLALIMLIFGYGVSAILIIQIIIEVISCILIFVVGSRLFNKKAGFLSALFFALSLVNAAYSVQILSETVFTLTLCCLLYLIAFRAADRLGNFVVLGIVWSLMVLCRPMGLYSFLIIVLLIFLNEKNIWLRLKKIMLFSIPAVLIISLWMYRNYSISGYYTISEIVSYNIYASFSVSLEASLTNESEEEIRSKKLEHFHARYHENVGICENKFDRIKHYSRLGKEVLLAHPFRYAALHLWSCKNNFIPAVNKALEIWGMTTGNKGTLAVLNKNGVKAAVKHYFGEDRKALYFMIPFLMIWMIFMLSFMVGIFLILRAKNKFHIVLLVVFGFYFVLVPGPVSLPRFMVPAMPFFSIIAGLGMYEWLKKRNLFPSL